MERKHGVPRLSLSLCPGQPTFLYIRVFFHLTPSFSHITARNAILYLNIAGLRPIPFLDRNPQPNWSLLARRRTGGRGGRPSEERWRTQNKQNWVDCTTGYCTCGAETTIFQRASIPPRNKLSIQVGTGVRPFSHPTTATVLNQTGTIQTIAP